MGLSLRNFGRKLGDVLGGVERQINPFDKGATYSNPHPVPNPASSSIAQRLASIPNTRLRGVEEVYNAFHKNASAPITLGSFSHKVPLLGNALRFGEQPNQSVGAFTKDIFKAGSHYAPYVAPVDAPILKGASFGARAVNRFIPVATTQVVADVAGGERNPRKLAINALESGAFNVGVQEIPNVVRGIKGNPILASEAGRARLPKISLSQEEVATGKALGMTPKQILKAKAEMVTPSIPRPSVKAVKQANKTALKSAVAPPPERLNITGKVTKDPRVKSLLTKISQGRSAASAEEALTAAKISQAARKAKVKVDQAFIDRYQAGKLLDSEKALGQTIRETTDPIFKTQQILSPDIQYRKNYVPQSYAQPSETVTEATRRLQLQTGARNPRAFETYAEAGKFGLTPKYQDLSQMIGRNAGEARRALGNKEVIEQGLKEGLFDVTPGRGWTPVEGFFDKGNNQIYAQKQLADTINGALQGGTSGLNKAIHTAAELAGKQQDVVLAGGYKQYNFFTFSQGVRDTTRNIGTALTGHPVRAVQQEAHLITDFLRSGSQNRTAQRFVQNSDFVKDLANEGLPLSFQTSLTDFGKGGLGKTWGKLFHNATFSRYLPNRMLSTAQEIYTTGVSKGLDHSQAIKLAANTTKQYMGLVDQIARGRSNATQDALGVVAFAPKYREGIINSLAHAIKSLSPTTFGDKSLKASRELAVGMIATTIGIDQLNRKLNGHGILENRKGQELSLQIPYGDKDSRGNQPVINIPIMPGYATVPRAIFGALKALKEGDIKQFTAETSKLASMPLQTVGRVLGNQDYFSRPIYTSQKIAEEEGIAPDSAGTAARKIATYVGGQLLPSYGRGVLDVAQGKPAIQGIAQGAELPLRFGKVLNPETQTYFDNRDKFTKSLNKNEQVLFNKLNPQKKNAVGGNIKPQKTPLTKASDYGDLVANPDFTKKYQAYQQSQPSHDPLWDLNPNDLRSYMQAQIISKNDPGGDSSTTRQLYARLPKDFFTKREQYFADLQSQGVNLPPQTSQKPQMPDNLVAFSERYHNLPYGTGQRSAALRSPEGQAYIAYLNQNRIYNNQERADLGLPPLEDSSNQYSYGGGGSSGRTSGRKRKNYVSSPYRYAVSLKAGGQAPSVKVSAKSTGAPKGRAKASSKPKVSIRKSLV